MHTVRLLSKWEATQPGLEIIGTGDSAARATEDMAGEIAEQQKRGELWVAIVHRFRLR